MHDIIHQLDEKRDRAALGGGQKRIDAQHAKGKLSATTHRCFSQPPSGSSLRV